MNCPKDLTELKEDNEHLYCPRCGFILSKGWILGAAKDLEKQKAQERFNDGLKKAQRMLQRHIDFAKSRLDDGNELPRDHWTKKEIEILKGNPDVSR